MFSGHAAPANNVDRRKNGPVPARPVNGYRRLMMDLRSRLTMPKPHASDPHAYQAGGYIRITQISTDGFQAYPEAVDMGFGPYVKYGQTITDYRNADQRGRYAPRKWSRRSGRSLRDKRG